MPGGLDIPPSEYGDAPPPNHLRSQRRAL
jgi:hypothetical protein